MLFNLTKGSQFNFDPNAGPGIISDPCRCFDTITQNIKDRFKRLKNNNMFSSSSSSEARDLKLNSIYIAGYYG